MIRHVFMWSVAEGADTESVFAQLASLEQLVPGLRNWSIGRQVKSGVHSSVGTWQYVLMADFDTRADLEAYENHPEHVRVLDEVFSTYKDWAVVDYEL